MKLLKNKPNSLPTQWWQKPFGGSSFAVNSFCAWIKRLSSTQLLRTLYCSVHTCTEYKLLLNYVPLQQEQLAASPIGCRIARGLLENGPYQKAELEAKVGLGVGGAVLCLHKPINPMDVSSIVTANTYRRAPWVHVTVQYMANHCSSWGLSLSLLCWYSWQPVPRAYTWFMGLHTVTFLLPHPTVWHQEGTPRLWTATAAISSWEHAPSAAVRWYGRQKQCYWAKRHVLVKGPRKKRGADQSLSWITLWFL